ncbi:MAG: hypothetical protein ACK4TF_05995 [Thermodesulfovibrionales bacterium]
MSIRSGVWLFRVFSASRPFSASKVSCPLFYNIILRSFLFLSSSSTINILAI